MPRKVVSCIASEYGTAHHIDFLKTFMQREAQKRATQKPQCLDPNRHVTLCQQIGQVQLIAPGYADCTKVNITGILGKLLLYCCFNTGMLGDCKPGMWKVAMTNAKWKVLMETFDWRGPMKEVD